MTAPGAAHAASYAAGDRKGLVIDFQHHYTPAELLGKKPGEAVSARLDHRAQHVVVGEMLCERLETADRLEDVHRLRQQERGPHAP